MASELISRAFNSFNNDNYNDAEVLCRGIMDSADNESHLMAFYLLGLIALERGDIENALNHLRTVVASSPLFAVFYHNYGVALVRAGDMEKAIACFHQAVALDPGSTVRSYPPTWRNLSDGTLLFDPGFVIDKAYAEAAKIVKLYMN